MSSAMERAEAQHRDGCLDNHDEDACEAVKLARELDAALAEVYRLRSNIWCFAVARREPMPQWAYLPIAAATPEREC